LSFLPSVGNRFWGINLEDISQPECFTVLETLQKSLNIPVWHDDQQGTALVTVAGVLGAVEVVQKSLDKIRVALIGAGASNIRIAHLLIKAGVLAENIVLCDRSGTLHRERKDLEENHPWKWELCQITNGDNLKGGKAEAIANRDLLIALSTPGPGVIKPEWIQTMNKDAIVFACANPNPEIWPWEAKEAGAKIVATGRSDFPNQVNNSLGFPGLFRGILSVQSACINDDMCIAASRAIYRFAQKRGLHTDYIIPSMEEWQLFIEEALAVAQVAIEQNLARKKRDLEELRKEVEGVILRAQGMVKDLVKFGYIPLPLEKQ
jgi:malate dehydrogenase (oxaloacetate-decarboxylating)